MSVREYWRVLVMLLVTGAVIYMAFLVYLENGSGTGLSGILLPSTGLFKYQYDSMPGIKKILYWNDAYGDGGFFFGYGREPFLTHKCPVNACYATHDRKKFQLHDVDALIWHLRANDLSFPAQRYPHTRYVLWMVESASNTFANLHKYSGIFNWTITYRSDSDFQLPAGRLRRLLPKEIQPAKQNYAQNKSKLAAWFVSNCGSVSKREILVRTLKKHINIDVYGRCGDKKCPRKENEKCDKLLDTDYKFYLSFENSLCFDYITEKFVRALRHDVVPVVYGLGYERYWLPDHSYIDVLDFASVKELADYLKYLDKNDTAYNEYFRWKSDYIVDTGFGLNGHNFCDLCARLHAEDPEPTKSDESRVTDQSHQNDTIEDRRKLSTEKYPKYLDNREIKQTSKPQIYKDLDKWFVQNQCTSPRKNKELNKFINGEKKAAGLVLNPPKLPISGVFG